jgi:hypothetical protein
MVLYNPGEYLEVDLIIIPREGSLGHLPRGSLALVYTHDEI